MEKIIVVVYQILGAIMSVVAQLPYVVDIDNWMITWGFTLLIFLVGLLMLLKGTNGPKGMKVTGRGILGSLFNMAIAAFAMMAAVDKAPEDLLSAVEIRCLGILVVLMVLVLAENLIVGQGNGLATICLWIGYWFVAALGLRVWFRNKTAAGMTAYQNLFPVSKFDDKYASWMQAHSFDSFITIGRWILILLCFTIGAILMAGVKGAIEDDYAMLSRSLVAAVFTYMVFLSHEGSSWNVLHNFLLFAVMVCAQMRFVFLIFYIPMQQVINMDKEKQTAIKVLISSGKAIIKAVITGILWAFSGRLCVNLVENGAMSIVVKPFSVIMTWFYRKLPEMELAYKTNFLHPAERVYLGLLVAAVLTVAVAILLFLILKVILGGLDYEGVSLTWLRNCILIFVIPVVLYWFVDMNAEQLGNMAVWLPVLLKATACMGLMICFGNIVPSIRKDGSMSLVKWTLVGLAATLLFSGLLVPVLMIFV